MASLRRKCGPSTKFTPVEEQKIIELVQILPENSWKQIAEIVCTKTAKQCRDRWTNYVNPKLNHGPWAESEDIFLLQKFQDLGPKWKTIAKFMPTRSPNDIRYRWMKLTDNDEENNRFALNDLISKSGSKPAENYVKTETKDNVSFDNLINDMQADLGQADSLLCMSFFDWA